MRTSAHPSDTIYTPLSGVRITFYLQLRAHVIWCNLSCACPLRADMLSRVCKALYLTMRSIGQTALDIAIAYLLLQRLHQAD